MSDKYHILMLTESTITRVPCGFSGYIWLDTKIALNKKVAVQSVLAWEIDKKMMMDKKIK